MPDVPTHFVLESSPDGGSAGRPRRVDSIIAGRRKSAPSTSGEAKPVRAPKEAPAGDGDQARAPRRRRRPRAEGAEPAEAARTRRAPARAARPAREARPPRETRPARAQPEPEAELEVALQPEAVIAPEAPPEVVEAPAPEPRRTATRTSPDGDLSGEVARLRQAVEQQRVVLAELRAGMLTLGKQVDRSGYRPRLGVFVDVPNLIYGFESAKSLHMGHLLDFLREGRELVRATAYSPVSDDPREPVEQQRFVAPFVPFDYRIVTKALKRFADGSIKGNFDVEMAIDMLSMADRVDVITIVSGDADFARAVEAVQSRGVRVEVAAFAGSTSIEMRAIADRYVELGSVIDRIL